MATDSDEHMQIYEVRVTDKSTFLYFPCRFAADCPWELEQHTVRTHVLYKEWINCLPIILTANTYGLLMRELKILKTEYGLGIAFIHF